ncbi:MAG TPA: hypothetical protein VF545_09325, partial [Thermoleophilaceae bacterium]
MDRPTPAWQRKVVAGLRASPSLELAGVRAVPRKRMGAVWRAHRAIERRLFPIGRDALAVAELDEAEARAPTDLLIWLSESAPPDVDRALRLVHGPAGDDDAGAAFRRAVAEDAPSLTTEARLGDRVVARTVSAVRPFSAELGANLARWKAADLVVRAAERLPGLDEPVAASTAPAREAPG